MGHCLHLILHFLGITPSFLQQLMPRNIQLSPEILSRLESSILEQKSFALRSSFFLFCLSHLLIVYLETMSEDYTVLTAVTDRCQETVFCSLNNSRGWETKQKPTSASGYFITDFGRNRNQRLGLGQISNWRDTAWKER